MKGREETIHRDVQLTLSMIPVLEALLTGDVQTMGQLGKVLDASNRGYANTYKNLCKRLNVPDVPMHKQIQYIISLFHGEKEISNTSGHGST